MVSFDFEMEFIVVILAQEASVLIEGLQQLIFSIVQGK